MTEPINYDELIAWADMQAKWLAVGDANTGIGYIAPHLCRALRQAKAGAQCFALLQKQHQRHTTTEDERLEAMATWKAAYGEKP